jgi:hypothetical protein
MGRVCRTQHIPGGDPADRQFSQIIAVAVDARRVRAVTPNKSAPPPAELPSPISCQSALSPSVSFRVGSNKTGLPMKP